MGSFRRAFARVQPYIEEYAYWAAGAVVLLEGVKIPMPGQALLIGSAVEAGEGRMNLAILIVLVTVTAVLGNSIGYGICRWAGPSVLTKFKVSSQRQQHLDDQFKRFGGLLVLLGRFVAGLRQFNGIVCRMMKMHLGLFMAYNIAGAVRWTGAWRLGTYYLDGRIHLIAAFVHHHRALLDMVNRNSGARLVGLSLAPAVIVLASLQAHTHRYVLNDHSITVIESASGKERH